MSGLYFCQSVERWKISQWVLIFISLSERLNSFLSAYIPFEFFLWILLYFMLSAQFSVGLLIIFCFIRTDFILKKLTLVSGKFQIFFMICHLSFDPGVLDFFFFWYQTSLLSLLHFKSRTAFHHLTILRNLPIFSSHISDFVFCI